MGCHQGDQGRQGRHEGIWPFPHSLPLFPFPPFFRSPIPPVVRPPNMRKGPRTGIGRLVHLCRLCYLLLPSEGTAAFAS